MPALFRPGLGNAAADVFVVSVSCSTSTSAMAAGVGPFRGIYVISTTSFSITTFNGNTIPLNAIISNSQIWIQGAFLSAIATATSQYGMI